MSSRYLNKNKNDNQINESSFSFVSIFKAFMHLETNKNSTLNENINIKFGFCKIVKQTTFFHSQTID